MSAITGTVDFAAIAVRASASSQCGTATRTMSTPVATSEAICCSVALMSAVFVVVIDWTEIGRIASHGDGAHHGAGASRGVRSSPRVSQLPKTWKVIVRSFGSSISKKSSRCHVPRDGSPSTTGIACDVADRSIAFTCA